MKPEPTDEQEQDRARSLFEQCWLGPLCLAFWVIVIVAVFYGCSAKGAECRIAWNQPPADQQITKWRIYVGTVLLAEPTTPTGTLVILPNAPCEVAVMAINSVGTSPPATMKVSYITDLESADMSAWMPLRSYHREFIAGRRFYRTKIETPP